MYKVYIIHTVNIVYKLYTVNTVYTTHTVFSVYTVYVGTSWHCCNSLMILTNVQDHWGRVIAIIGTQDTAGLI